MSPSRRRGAPGACCVCCPCVLQREPARILGRHGGGGFVPRRDGAEEGGRGEEEAVRAQEVAGCGHVVVGWVAYRPFPAPLGPRAGRAPSLPATAGGDPLAAAGAVDRRGLTGRHRRRRSIIIPGRHRRGQLRHLPEPHHGAVHRVPGESGRARPTRAGSPPSATDPGGAPSTRRRRLRSPTSCGRSARRPGGCATTRSTSTASRGGSRPGRCARCAASSGSSRSTAAEPRPERRSWKAAERRSAAKAEQRGWGFGRNNLLCCCCASCVFYEAPGEWRCRARVDGLRKTRRRPRRAR